MPFDALFVPEPIRAAVSDEAWVDAMVAVERALAAVEEQLGLVPPGTEAAFDSVGVVDPAELAREARRSGNPIEPLVRRLPEHAHFGATSQDILDTAAMLVARESLSLVATELHGVARACAALAEAHRNTVMAGRTVLQQATPITFGLKAAQWLTAALAAEESLDVALPAQLGGASGTLAALGVRGPEVVEAFARELRLEAPSLPWHATRTPVLRIAAGLAISATTVANVATDVVLLAQTEVGEVREASAGVSSTMPHKRNPVGSTLARACAAGAGSAAQLLLRGVHEHERAAGAWHAEWRALSDAIALTGGAAAWLRGTLEALEVDGERMRANIREETLSEARRLGISAERPDDYLGAAGVFVDRALDAFRAAESR